MEKQVHSDVTKSRAQKSGTSFILLDQDGEMPADPETPSGIYRDDVRLVRAFTVAVREPSTGQSAPVTDKETVFYDGNLYHRLTVSPYEQSGAALVVNFIPGCDDIFDVRNEEIRALPHEQKPFRADILSTKKDQDGMVLTATGHATEREYRTGFASSHAGHWDNERFEITLDPARTEPQEFYFVVGDENTRLDGSPSEQFAKARQGAEHDHQTLQHFGPHLSVADQDLNTALQQAQEDLSVLITDLETGPYPYAGLPWFSCPFGRDASITALLVLDLYPELARGVLAFQAEKQAQEENRTRQAEPGKIFHEIRFGESSAAGENPFSAYYGGVDSTALFVMLAGAYYEKTGDETFIRSIHEHIENALAWIGDNMDQNGGFVRYSYDKNGLTQQCWKDSADSMFDTDNPPQLAKDPIAVCEVQAYAYEALKAGEVFAALVGEHDKAQAYKDRADELRAAFNEKFWMEDQGCYAMALDGNDRQIAVVSSNAGHTLLSHIVPQERAEMVAKRLMEDDSFSGYGIRTLAEGPGYDPMSYHRGSVWPHDTAMVALGMRKKGFDDLSNRLADGLLKVYRHTGQIPELFSGDALKDTEDTGPRPYPASCIIQAWAAAAFISLSMGKHDLSTRNVPPPPAP